MDLFRVWWHSPAVKRITGRFLNRSGASQCCRHCNFNYRPKWLNPRRYTITQVDMSLPCLVPQVARVFDYEPSAKLSSSFDPKISYKIRLVPPQITEGGNVIDSLEIYKNTLIRWLDTLKNVSILLTSLGSHININEKEMIISGMPLKIYKYLSLRSFNDNLAADDISESSTTTNLALIFPQLTKDELDAFSSESSFSNCSTTSFCSI